jgi:hypothetical protein
MKKDFILIFLIILSGCTTPSQNNIKGILSGVAGYVPKNHPHSSNQDWSDFFTELPSTGEVFGNYVNWESISQINLTMNLMKKNKMIPVIAIGFDIDIVNSTYFSDNKKAMQEAILQVVNSYDLSYLAIGVEVNRLISRVSNESFNDFVKFYKETYDLIKNISSNTKVFTIFQLELMKGKSKLTGLQNLSKQWYILNDFNDKLDLTAFTTYPFLEYNKVSEIPTNYYSEINNYVSNKIAFTEIGWPSNLDIINTSEQDQLIFLKDFINQTKVLEIEFLIYSFLHEADFEIYIFNTIGLKHIDGTKKPVYEYWINI